MEKEIKIYDTTLRDGIQGAGINPSVEEAIKIAKTLDNFGIDYIEGGWPGTNPNADEFFKKMLKINLKHAVLTSFGSTRKAGIDASEDKNLQALINSQTPVVTIFGKSWLEHVKMMKGNTPEENLKMISESIEFLKSHNREVIYDAEHFFDGYKDNPKYAIKTLIKATEAGADYLTLCDTNGGTLPFELEKNLEDIFYSLDKYFDVNEKTRKYKLGIHAHDDSGLATANSLTAINYGCKMVQGTINGFGERIGNADLITLMANFKLKINFNFYAEKNMKNLTKFSKQINKLTSQPDNPKQPFVGKDALAHKGGVHVSAVLKKPSLYEHFNPNAVGNKRHILGSNQAGKSNIVSLAEEFKLDLSDKNISNILEEIKKKEKEGYAYDKAPDSLRLLFLKESGGYKELFKLDSCETVTTINKLGEEEAKSILQLKGGTLMESWGNGPVNALNKALLKALIEQGLKNLDIKLTDYNIEIINREKGSAAKTRVFITTKDTKTDKSWKTTGVSTDIISASFEALKEASEYKLLGLDK
ncbi:MAG: citramalate synthase [Candidatus Pacebacteria bacterium]|nr:citramalate synthase [Candidatus Paceibacterota bacterium]